MLIEVELDDGAEPLLPECYIFEAPDDILDADELNGEDATIEVAVHRHDYVVGGRVRVGTPGGPPDKKAPPKRVGRRGTTLGGGGTVG